MPPFTGSRDRAVPARQNHRATPGPPARAPASLRWRAPPARPLGRTLPRQRRSAPETSRARRRTPGGRRIMVGAMVGYSSRRPRLVSATASFLSAAQDTRVRWHGVRQGSPCGAAPVTKRCGRSGCLSRLGSFGRRVDGRAKRRFPFPVQRLRLAECEAPVESCARRQSARRDGEVGSRRKGVGEPGVALRAGSAHDRRGGRDRCRRPGAPGGAWGPLAVSEAL